MNIVFCTDGIFPFAIGGMQRHSRLLIEELARNKMLNIVVIHPHNETVFDPVHGIREIKLQGIDTSKNYLKECFAYSGRVAAELEKLSDHIIYSQGLSVWKNCEKYKHRLIINPHGLEPFQAIGFKDKLIAIPFKRVFRKLFSNAKKVVSLGGELTTILRKNVSPQQLVELPNGVILPPVQHKKFDDARLNFLFVSRFAHNKGIHILMQALNEILKEHPSFTAHTFTLAGKGPLYQKYLAQNKNSNIKLIGFIDDEKLFSLYKSAHCFILPTLFEGMPTVILEAMAYSTPVIATNTGAIDVMVNQSNGYLIERNSVDQLKKAIVAFIELNSVQKELLSVNARTTAEKFSWDKVADLHVQVFQTIKL